MANKLGTTTINGVLAISCDTDPSLSGGLIAPIGSFASAVDGSGFYYKSTVSNTGWSNTIGNVNNSISSSVTTSTTSTSDVVISGMVLMPTTGLYSVSFNCQYEILSGNVTGQCASDLASAYSQIMLIPSTVTSHLATFGLGETLTAGIYEIVGAGSVSGTLTLDGQGDSNSVFIFRFSAALSSVASSNVILINGASISNIFWVAEGAISLGASTQMKGLLLSNNGAVTLGASCNLQGRIFSKNGALGVDSSTLIRPTASYINIGILDTFAIFTSIGNVTNTSVSIITGDIGTNSGTVSGFGSAVVNGTIYLQGIDNNALATFSIYEDGILIPNSVRTRTLNINTVDVALSAICNVGDGGSIDVRYNVDAGTILSYNRILIASIIR